VLLDLFVYSKVNTLDRGWTDYQWVYKPDYFDGSLGNIITSLKKIFETAANHKFIHDDGCKNMFFVASNDGCALFRICESASWDQTGREIYSIEGFSTKKKNIKKFWWNLPNLIYVLSEQNRIFRDSTDSRYAKKDFPVSEEYTSINVNGSTRFLPLDLQDDIFNAKQAFSFVLGTKPASFYPHSFTKHYKFDYSHLRSNITSHLYETVKLKPQKSSVSFSIYVEFSKDSRGINVVVKAGGREIGTLMQTDVFQFNNKIDTSILNSAAAIMCEELVMRGYKLSDSNSVL